MTHKKNRTAIKAMIFKLNDLEKQCTKVRILDISLSCLTNSSIHCCLNQTLNNADSKEGRMHPELGNGSIYANCFNNIKTTTVLSGSAPHTIDWNRRASQRHPSSSGSQYLQRELSEEEVAQAKRDPRHTLETVRNSLGSAGIHLDWLDNIISEWAPDYGQATRITSVGYIWFPIESWAGRTYVFVNSSWCVTENSFEISDPTDLTIPNDR